MNFMGKAAVGLVAVGLAGGSMLGAGTANAAGLHGAIAFSLGDWSYGTSVNLPNRTAAIDEALATCAGEGASDCEVMVAWSDGCGAIVYRNDDSDDLAVGTGSGRDRATALRNAYASLAEYYPRATLANVGSSELSQTGISKVVCTANAG